jgi:ribosomal protein L28
VVISENGTSKRKKICTRCLRTRNKVSAAI